MDSKLWNVTNAIPPTDNSVISFLAAIVINLVIGLITLLVFSIIRNRFKHVYLSSYLLNTTKLVNEMSESQMSTLNRLKLSTSPFSWAIPSFRITDDDLFDLAGVDIFVYLRFVRLCLKFFALLAPYGLLVLIPVNVSGDSNLPGMASITLGNIKLSSQKLWTHLVGVWIYSLLIYYLLYKEWLAFTNIRQTYLRKGYEEQFTLFVSDLPLKLQSDQNLGEYMNDVFPEKIASVHVFKKLDKWFDLVVKHDDALRKYERSQAVYRRTNGRPKHRKYVLFGRKLDSLSIHERTLKQLNDSMISEQEKQHQSLRYAVVTFTTLKDTVIGLQTCWNISPFNMFVTPAPASTDLIWDNLKLPNSTKPIRYTIVSVLLFLLVFFWSTPVLIVSSMVSLQALQERLPFLEGVNETPALVKGFVEGFLASLVLEVFFSILPDIMAFLARMEGIISRSQVTISCIGKLFIFQIVNKFLGVLFGGALLTRLTDITNNPTYIPRILAESMPSMANLFINVIMLRSLTGLPMDMLQLFRLLKISILKKWWCETERENKEVWKPPPIKYPGMFALDLFMFIVGIGYSILSPIVTVFVVVYFAMAYVTRFYLLIYVRKSTYQSGGLMWPKVFNRMIVGIMVFQFLMIGVFALKHNAVVSLFCLPLPVLTILFFKFTHNHFDRSTVHLNLSLMNEITPPQIDGLKTWSQKYNKMLFLPNMFSLSTDKVTTKPSEEYTEKPDGESHTGSSHDVELYPMLNRQDINHDLEEKRL